MIFGNEGYIFRGIKKFQDLGCRGGGGLNCEIERGNLFRWGGCKMMLKCELEGGNSKKLYSCRWTVRNGAITDGLQAKENRLRIQRFCVLNCHSSFRGAKTM